MEPSEFKYLIPVTVNVEERTEDGRKFLTIKFTNEAILEFKTSQTEHIAIRKTEGASPEEQAISQQIADEVHECFRMLNPS